jgi:hypothetical protein
VSPAATNQVAPAQEAGRPQPQTTVEAAGGPFIRHSQPGRRQQYANTGAVYGGVVQQPLVAVPGYLRNFKVRIASTGGSASGTSTSPSTADAPFNAVSQVILKDAFGTPLIVGPGYEVLKLVNKYSSQGFLFTASDPINLPSYTSIVTASGGSTGNFTFQTQLPLEFSKAYGVISGANASVLPTLQFQYAGTPPQGTFQGVVANSLELDVDNDFYWLPEGAQIEPPGLGTTCQWVFQQCNPTIASGATTRVQLPRLGGYIHTLIFVLRDTGASNARINGWGTRTRIYVDGVPLWDTRDDEWLDDIYNNYCNFASTSTTAVGSGQGIETGVRVLSRRMSLNQINLGLLDTGEAFLSTNPGTLIEVEGAPWATTGTGPFQLSVLAGQVVPSGTLIQGLPEV